MFGRWAEHLRGLAAVDLHTNMNSRMITLFCLALAVFTTGVQSAGSISLPLRLGRAQRQNGALISTKSGSGTGASTVATVVSLGTPARDFLVALDLNSADFWVPAAGCACAPECDIEEVCADVCGAHCCGNRTEPEDRLLTGTCTNKNVFDGNASRSFVPTNNRYPEEVLGKIVNARLGYDSFRLGAHVYPALTVRAFQFGTLQDFPEGYERAGFDGVLGLARAAPNRHAPKTAMQQLLTRRVFTEPYLSVFLPPRRDTDLEDGLVTFGGLDRANCDTEQRQRFWHPVLSANTWAFRIDSTNVSTGQLTNRTWTGLVDLAEEDIVVPDEVYQLVLRYSARFGERDPASGKELVQCATSSNLYWQLFIGAQTVSLQPKHLLTTFDSMGRCLLNVRNGGETDEWRLGRVFLKHVCAVFDYQQGRVGLPTFTGASLKFI